MKKLTRYLLLLAIFLASSWSLFRPGFFRAHDYTHAARISEMTLALKDGHFPVRWTRNFGFGYGMPLFEFYAPLPFYIGSFFYYLGLDVVLSIKILYFLANGLTALGIYLLIKELFVYRKKQSFIDQAALLATAAFTLAPYRAVNLFVRGALSEAWGIMTFPWILLGIVKLVKREKNAWQILLLALVVLFLSHSLMTMIFVPVSLVFAVGYLVVSFCEKLKFKKSQIITFFGKLTGIYLLAIGLASFYLFPAFLEKGFTQMEERIAKIGGYFDFHLHFIYLRQLFRINWGYGGSGWGPNDDISFFLGFGQIAVLALSSLYLIKVLWLKFKNRASLGLANQQVRSLYKKTDNNMLFLALFAFIFLGIGVLFSTPKTLFFWENISLLTYIQFPWRFLSLVILCTSLLTAAALSFVNHKKMFYLLFILTLLNGIFFRPQKYLDDADGYYYTDQARIRKNMSGILPDFIPIAMPMEFKSVDRLVLNDNLSENYQILVDRTHQKLIKINFNENRILELAIASYPGWQAELDGKPLALATTEFGNLSAVIPAGDHLLGVYFGSTPVRFYADLVSLASFLIIGYLLINQSIMVSAK